VGKKLTEQENIQKSVHERQGKGPEEDTVPWPKIESMNLLQRDTLHVLSPHYCRPVLGTFWHHGSVV
jgi:hypothetical protein